jgi:pimeloyl-ACP methyl ester carboxylesterase
MNVTGKTTGRPLSRRSLLKGTAPAIAGGLAAISVRQHVLARPGGAPPATPSPGVPKPGDAKIWSHDYWANKADVKLYMFRKRLGAPQSGETPLPVLFLVHGSSNSSRASFDLHVPGHGEYSLMDKFAGYGFDVWTMDFEGYGRSTQTDNNSDVACGVEDLKAAVEVVARETGQQSFHFLGESSGALRAGAFAMVRPERIRRLILAAFTYTGQGSPTLAKRAEQLDYYRTHNRRPRDRNMIRSIFTRDKPGTSDPAVAEALADYELQFGDTIPTGTYLDMTAKLPLVDPLKVHAPVLIVRGEFDGIATEADLFNFFTKLPNADRQFSIIPGAVHAVSLGYNRELLWHVTRAFLEMPPRRDEPQKG